MSERFKVRIVSRKKNRQIKTYQVIFLYSLSIVIFFRPFHVQAKNFHQIWSEILSRSYMEKSHQFKLEQLNESKERISNQWMPKIYLEAQALSSNEPANVLFGKISSGHIEESDFGNDRLNRPGHNFFQKGTVGLNLSLYEGGITAEQASIADANLDAQKNLHMQSRLAQYSAVAHYYSNIGIFRSYLEKVAFMKKDISSAIKSYEIGQKSNPVGYSGLLGMKSFLIRLQGLEIHFRSQISQSLTALRELGLPNPQEDEFDIQDGKEFVQKYLSINSNDRKNISDSSFGISAQRSSLIVQKKLYEIEKTLYRPKLGFFAESGIVGGSRGSQVSNSVGLYLQWSLFDSSERFRYKEALLNYQAFDSEVLAKTQEEKTQIKIFEEREKSLYANFDILQQSDQILNDQLQVVTKLFRNGNISALQLVEVLNRRLDVLTQKIDVELQVVKVRTEQISRMTFEIPDDEKMGTTN